jgi:hypothetical protein
LNKDYKDEIAGKEIKVEIKADEVTMQGVYSNLASISHAPEEFYFDFVSIFHGTKNGKLVSRIIMSPAHAKRFFEALQNNIKIYEQHFGPISTPVGPTPRIDFIQ